MKKGRRNTLNQKCTRAGIYPEGEVKYAEDLDRFLDRRDSSAPFHIGDWLKTIDTERLGRMVDAAWQCVVDGQGAPCGYDMRLTAWLSYVAETGRRDVRHLEKRMGELVRYLYFAALFEILRRRGGIKLLTPIRVNPEMGTKFVRLVPLPARLFEIPGPEAESPSSLLH